MQGYDACMYPPTARSVTDARRRAAEVVSGWGYPEQAGDAGLLVSELASNAVRYGRVPGRLFRVEVALTEAALRVAVSDARGENGPEAVPDASPGEDAERGRGLLIVSALAARWNVEALPVGKRIWAELDLVAPHF